MTQKNKQKQEQKRGIIEIFNESKKIDKDTIIKIFDIVLKSKTKGEMIFEILIFIIIVIVIVYLICYFM